MRREEEGSVMGRQADTASHYWTTFLRPNPKLAAAFSHGLAYEGEGRYDRAVADHNEAIRLNPPVKPPLLSATLAGRRDQAKAECIISSGKRSRRISAR